MSTKEKETIEEVEQRYKRVTAQMNDLYDGIFRHIAETAATEPRRAEGMLFSLRNGKLAGCMMEGFWSYDGMGLNFWKNAVLRSKEWLWLCSDEYIKGYVEGESEASGLMSSLYKKLEADDRVEDFYEAMQDKDLYKKLLDEYGIR